MQLSLKAHRKLRARRARVRAWACRATPSRGPALSRLNPTSNQPPWLYIYLCDVTYHLCTLTLNLARYIYIYRRAKHRAAPSGLIEDTLEAGGLLARALAHIYTTPLHPGPQHTAVVVVVASGHREYRAFDKTFCFLFFLFFFFIIIITHENLLFWLYKRKFIIK